MCSAKEVAEIVDAAEARGEERLRESHMAIAKTISDIGMGIKEDRENNTKEHKALHSKLNEIDVDTINEIVSGVKGFSAVKNVVTGTASLFIAIGALGASVIWVVKTIVSK